MFTLKLLWHLHYLYLKFQSFQAKKPLHKMLNFVSKRLLNSLKCIISFKGFGGFNPGTPIRKAKEGKGGERKCKRAKGHEKDWERKGDEEVKGKDEKGMGTGRKVKKVMKRERSRKGRGLGLTPKT